MKKVSNVTKDVATQKNNEAGIVALERYAIIQTGGKQYFAVEGKTLAIEKLPGVAGEEVLFYDVLLRRESAAKLSVGQPFLEKPVVATIVKHMRSPKIIVFKFKRRKKYRTKQGHRQSQTVVRFTTIG